MSRVRTPGASAKPDTDTSAAAETAPLPESQPAASADLPNAVDVDPKQITAPVLTKQGWVCPDESERAKPRDAYKP